MSTMTLDRPMVTGKSQVDAVISVTAYLPTEQEIIDRDYHAMCGCPIPYVYKKWNGFLGRFVAIRLCCLALAVETLTGQKLITVEEFQPTGRWDCLRKQKHPVSGEMEEIGPPPVYLCERMRKKGLPVDNLDAWERRTKYVGV